MSNKNTLVISVDVRETRVALIEDGIIAELHIERRSHQDQGTVGNVYLGKVTRVLPGLQAAFIDIGQERAAFLHVEDLIRPDDFDAYLAGGRKQKTEAVSEEIAEEVSLEAEAQPALMTAGDAHVSGDAIIEPGDAIAPQGVTSASASEDGEDQRAHEPSDASHPALETGAAVDASSDELIAPRGDDSQGGASALSDASEADLDADDEDDEDDEDGDTEDTSASDSDDDEDEDDGAEDEAHASDDASDGDVAAAHAEVPAAAASAASLTGDSSDDSGPDLFSDAAHAVDAAPSGPSLTGSPGSVMVKPGRSPSKSSGGAAGRGARAAPVPPPRPPRREPGRPRPSPGSRGSRA
jgi:ribonuclease G